MQHPFDTTNGLRHFLSQQSDESLLEILQYLLGDILRPANPAKLDLDLLPDDFVGYCATARSSLERGRITSGMALLLIEQICTLITAATVPDLVRTGNAVRFKPNAQGELPWDDVLEHVQLTGFAIIDEYLGAGEVAALEADIGVFEGEVRAGIAQARAEAPGANLRTGDLLVLQDGSALPTFDERAVHAKTVVLPREGVDEGVVDVFNPDLAMPGLAPRFDRWMRSEQLLKLVRAVGGETQIPGPCHVYFNTDVVRTRSYHLDGILAAYKTFIYATDVSSLEDGPFCIFPTTQRKDHPLKLLNVRFNERAKVAERLKYDMFLADERLSVPVLGRAGTLIIGAIHAMHRGLPQAEGRGRVALVQTYKDARHFYPLAAKTDHPRLSPKARAWVANGGKLPAAAPSPSIPVSAPAAAVVPVHAPEPAVAAPAPP
ncbi:MAG: hypothetical protein AAF447_15730, partial [Myxococcota bacterium]